MKTLFHQSLMDSSDIYIYMCVCVCVCVWKYVESWINQTLKTYFKSLIYSTFHIFLSYCQIHNNLSFQYIYIYIYISRSLLHFISTDSMFLSHMQCI